MGLIRTYIDAGVLIAAARSASRLSQRAIAVLDDTIESSWSADT